MNMGIPKRLFMAALIAVLMVVPASLLIEGSDSTGLDHSQDYYYNQLSEREQALYRQIYSAAINFDTELTTGFDNGTLKGTGLEVVCAVRFDHPELFQLESSVKYSESGKLTLEYSISESQYSDMMKTIEDEAEKMLTGIPSNRAGAVAWLNDKIVSGTVYDTDAVDNDNKPHAHDISGVFVDGKAVCEGYALAFKYLCDRCDIPCISVIGSASEDGTDPIGHMWNYVMMGEKWYAMDVTWNDPLVGGKDSGMVYTSYSLVGSSTIVNGVPFDESHTVDNVSKKLGLPELQENKYIVPIGKDTSADYSDFVPYYYSKLDSNGKKAYDAIVKGVLSFDTEIETGVHGDSEALTDAVRAVRFDRQDLFQIPKSFTYYESDGRILFDYPMTSSEYEKMTEKIVKAMAPLNQKLTYCTSTYERVLAIHDYLVSNMVYEKTSDHAWDIYGAFVEKKGVCESYARSFQYMCAQCGINAICVSGTGINSAGSEGHMWNMVQMNDGFWYEMDVTWDDPLVNGSDSGKVRHTYFLIGSDTKDDGKMFSESHLADMEPIDKKTEVFHNTVLPAASKSDYYIRPGETPQIDIDIYSKGTADKCSLTFTVEDLNNALNIVQGVGKATFPFDGIKTKVGMTSSGISALLAYMEQNSLTEMTLISEKATGKVKLGPLELDNQVYSFSLTAGSNEIPLSKIGKDFTLTLCIPFEVGGLDFITPLIFAWNSENALTPIAGSTFSDGYVTAEVSSLDDSLTVGSTPVKDVPVIILIIAIILLLVLLKILLGHRKNKKK